MKVIELMQEHKNNYLILFPLNRVIIILILVLSQSCATSNNDDLIEGVWTNCESSAGVVGGYIYTELKFSNNLYNEAWYGALDNECINIEYPPEASIIFTSGKYNLHNFHISSSGLKVYDIDVFERTRESNLGVSTQLDFFNIVFIESDRMYFGKFSKVFDASSEDKRPSEINFESFFVKK